MVTATQFHRGELWWAIVDKRRPVLIVQADFLNKSDIAWILSVPLTSNLGRSGFPGNVRFTKRDTGLDRLSVANVSQVSPIHKSCFAERIGRLSDEKLQAVDDGLALVLAIDHRMA